jgi:branched-subunit amino acid aminotransferase/4-amino-4-deoxychorismate lyase
MAEFDGRPVTVAELQTLALTNYGHFTSFRAESGRVRGLPLHLDRLVRDCQAVFGVALDPDHVRGLVRRVAPTDDIVTIRVTVFDPETDLGHPAGAGNPRILVTHRRASPLPLPPITAQTTVFVRDSPEIKSVGLFGTLRQRRIAQVHGFDDALFTDESGYLSEGGTWNIGLFDGQHITWPDAPCLPGVTMRLLQHPSHKIAPVTTSELGSMRAAFATNAAIGVRAITRINDIVFPEHDVIFDELRTAYLSIEPDLL